MKIQTIYNNRLNKYFIRRVLFGFIPFGYYEINDLLRVGDMSRYFFNKHYIESYCGVTNHANAMDAVAALRREIQQSKLPKHEVISIEEI